MSKTERVQRTAIINNKEVPFDFIPGDLVQNKHDGSRGYVTEVFSFYVNIDWIEENPGKGKSWLVESIEHVPEEEK